MQSSQADIAVCFNLNLLECKSRQPCFCVNQIFGFNLNLLECKCKRTVRVAQNRQF